MPWRQLLPLRDSTPKGTVYLLHFSRPFGHAQHYIGFSTQVDQRLEDQLKGSGARLVKLALAAGIDMMLAAEFPEQSVRFEMQLKNRGGAGRWCPICKRLNNGTE